jgi:hypothetical protein
MQCSSAHAPIGSAPRVLHGGKGAREAAWAERQEMVHMQCSAFKVRRERKPRQCRTGRVRAPSGCISASMRAATKPLLPHVVCARRVRGVHGV